MQVNTASIDEVRGPATDRDEPPRIAVVGAGVAGAACAAGLLRAGFDVTVFDKSRGVGGRMATRRAAWADVDGVMRSAAFDHGCPHFTVTRPRFQVVVDRAVAVGAAIRWRQQVYARFPAAQRRDVVVPTPTMPAFCRHLLHGVPMQLGHAVTGLQRCRGGWMLQLADRRAEGPFEQVVLAIPAAQAPRLLRGHHDDWADALDDVPMAPCWTLMAVTDDLDWRWDAAQVERSELAWIARNDRVPGRVAAGLVPWVAHATPTWSLAHLEDDPASVRDVLCAALGRALTSGAPPRRHHASVHRWRYAERLSTSMGGPDSAPDSGPSHWWNPASGLGVCGDAVAHAAGDGPSGSAVEAAWCSGDALAALLVAPPSTARHRRLASFLPLSEPTTGEPRWAPLDAHS